MELLIELTLSFMTMGIVYLAGDKRPIAPAWGFITECCWLGYILHKELYGLLLMNICLIILYARMYLKWKNTSN